MTDVLGIVAAVLVLWVAAWAVTTAVRAATRRLRRLRDRRAGSALRAAVLAEVPPLVEELGELPTREELEASRAFAAAADRVRGLGVGAEGLTRLARDGNRWVSRLALAALIGRDDLPPGWPSTAVRRLRQSTEDQAWLLLRTLEQVPDPVVGPVLSQLDEVRQRDAAELVAARLSAELETVDAETLRKNVPLRFGDDLEAMCAESGDILPYEFWETVLEWRAAAASSEPASADDVAFLSGFAKVWERPFDAPPALLTRDRELAVDVILESLTSDPPESVLLVGEHGVGKTSLVRAALERLDPSWLVFEATASSINAGAMFVGELEGRVEELAARLRNRDAVWVLPTLEDALYAGRHSMSPRGLLDHLLPHVESGELHIVTEASPAVVETIVAQRPRLTSAFRVLRVRPLDERDSVAVARHALEHARLGVTAPDGVLAEAFELAQQFLPTAAPPGNLVPLVVTTAATIADEGGSSIDAADVLGTLASATGLPLALLDAGAPLDLDAVRTFFEQRVLGQPEAVECLVERIALVKAGLTDPTRPLGVFLFVGPTGTGKTEIAKAFAEFLFGSPNRLVRLDMSEYQTPESLERLLADTALEPQGAPLIAAVRKDPFSVVLLDEFEKAAAPVWDVFLQVFDDGRLTDSHGRTVDFRRCVIVMTSNVGASILGLRRPGFERGPEPFRPEAVERAVTSSFRPEFLNRIDRVVVFRPFERAHMRALLDKELADVTLRRGFRGRPWAVEYDESALAFLIDEGFSPELGARPLKRAVERHLLTPLARAIAAHEVPAGDQFLFVTAAPGRLDVRFVDPDADLEQDPGDLPEPDRAAPPELDLRTLVLKPRADAGAIRLLADELERVRAGVTDAALRRRKEAALAAVGEPGFWERESRFVTLAEAEYLDRLEAAFRTAAKLGERLRGRPARDGKGAAELVALLASRLHVLEHALADAEAPPPYDVLLRLHAVADAGDGDAGAFAAELVDMYVGWAARRGMRAGQPAGAGGRVLAVSGLGARRILGDEAGLHLLELPDEQRPERPADRIAVAVQVAPWPLGLALEEPGAAERVAAELARAPAPTRIVRRYRRDPTPLVRDAVRGFRTGRLDRVLAGDFDVL